MEMGYNIQTQPKVVKVIKRTTEDFQRILNESFVDN